MDGYEHFDTDNSILFQTVPPKRSCPGIRSTSARRIELQGSVATNILTQAIVVSVRFCALQNGEQHRNCTYDLLSTTRIRNSGNRYFALFATILPGIQTQKANQRAFQNKQDPPQSNSVTSMRRERYKHAHLLFQAEGIDADRAATRACRSVADCCKTSRRWAHSTQPLMACAVVPSKQESSSNALFSCLFLT